MAGVRLSAMVGTEERFATTDETGRYFLPLPSGNHEVKMEAEGFVPQTFQKTVKIGLKSRLNVTMERVQALVPAPVEQPIIAPAQALKLTGVVEAMGNGIH